MTELLTDQEALAALCRDLTKASWVGLDTEFVRERTYYAELCLVQLALPDALVLVDPLRVDIRPLAQALQGPGLKIVHAGRQDLELLLQETEGLPSPLFDTQIAAALIGHHDQIGYGNLVAQLLSVELNKDATRTNWALRPLSERQLAYAQDDVRYLDVLHDKLASELSRLGRMDWLREDCQTLTDPNLYRFHPDQLVHRYRQGANLSPVGQALFQDLLVWREAAAKAADLPRNWVFPDAILAELAAHPPKDRADLATRRGLNHQSLERWGDALMATVDGAESSPRRAWAAPRLDPDEERLYTALVAHVDACAKALGIEAGVLCSRRALKEMVQGGPSGNLARGWRAEVLGPRGAHLLAEVAGLHAQSA